MQCVHTGNMSSLSQLERQAPEVVSQAESAKLFPRPGVQDHHLQHCADLPPAEPDNTSPKYYLHVTYQQCGDRMTCTTTVRAHACERKVGSAGQLCNPCSESRALVLNKHLREKHAEQKDLRKCAHCQKSQRPRLPMP